MAYNPGVVFEGGQLIGQGIDRAAQTIGDAILQHKRDLQEKQGYTQVLKALASDPNNGIDADSIDKMTLGQAKGSIMAAEIRRQQAATRQQQQATAAIPGFLATYGQAQQPTPGNPNVQPPGSLFTSLAGGAVPPVATGNQRKPGLDARSALGLALQKFAPVLNDPEVRSSIIAATIKNGLMPKQPLFTTDPGGRPIAIDPTGRVQWAPGGQPKTQPELLDIGGQKVLWDGSTGKMIDTTPRASNKPTRDPGDGPTVSKDGKFYWDENLQAWKPLSTGKGGDIYSRFGPAPTAAPAVPKEGDVVDGYKFKGGDPADQANWEKTENE